jgi:adenine-specific DNA-methyltransferase
MAKYGCEICQKTFSQKGHLEDHHKRKRPCKKDNRIEALVEQKVKEALSKTNTAKKTAINTTMDYSKKTREELITVCKEKKIKGYSGKKKEEIVLLLTDKDKPITNLTTEVLPEKFYRLNYIGSKFQLLEWITNNIKEKTGWTSFANKIIGDLFAGTGIVSYHFRKNLARVISNDAELYSSIITHAFTRSIYTEKCKKIIDEFQTELRENKHSTTDGFITTHYSPQGSTERKFFTIENAKRIDYIRNKLEIIKDTISEDEYKFILASILLSADAVSNVPAVYGCFLKNFKTKAVKTLTLLPIHNSTLVPVAGSNTYSSDVLNGDFLSSFESDLVYLDPPYNERQYSKNYFPLNIIAKTPEKLLTELPLKGKTGIPTDCFISPFCKRGDSVEKAFDLLFRELKTKWVFLSYNSESIVSKEKMLNIMKKYGTASVIERDYKRFKSFEYNKDVNIKEYLFCLNKS